MIWALLIGASCIPCKQNCKENVAASLPAALQGPSPETERYLLEMESAVKHFKDVSEVIREDIKLGIEYRYQQRRVDLTDAYEAQIQDIEVDERQRRIDAIAVFEAFLEKYPSDEAYTPDTMFRLAELYFERANDEYYVTARAYEAATKDDPDNPNAVAPVKDYSRTVGLYRDLIANFPKYRLLDGAYYLLGYCLGEQGQDDQAIATYQQLSERFPESRFVAEAWTRVGEYAFDQSDLAKAVDAYTRVLDYKTSTFYDKALYKLAWTHYRMDHFDDAVQRFAELIDDAEAKKGKKGGELRNEALQYMAASFSEEGWGSLKRARDFFDKLGGRAWAAEVYAMLGEAYFEQSKYPEAIAALELALKAAPRFKNAPKWQDRIVTSYERQRDFVGAARARDVLAVNYVEGTPWYEENVHDPDVVMAARDLSEKSLMAAAVFHHRQAQSYKDAGKLEEAKNAYAEAAVSYERYLKRFASAKNRYEITYYVADCLYYSLQFGPAAAMYAAVRDDPSESTYREIAAYSAVLASERNVQLLEQKGTLTPAPTLKASERADRPAKRADIPPEKMALIDAVDGYLTWAKPNEKTPSIAFKAAEALYAYDHFEEARGRFQCIIDNYPTADVARFSVNLTIESFLTEKNWDEVERFSGDVLTKGSIAKGKQDFVDELKKFRLGAMFKRAEELETKEKFEIAAAEYIRIVDENPQGTFADKALNNAAVNYEKARRFESATRLYERIPKEYPQSSLADYALFRVGVASERFYDFDKAITAYLKLVESYPQSKHRPDALYNAALALENTQRYDRAAELYRRYVDSFPDRKDAADVFFRAARATEQASGRAAAIAAYEQFIKRYEKDSANDERVVEATFRIGELYDKAGNEAAAKKAYATATAEASKRRKGQAFAAQAQFQLGEIEFRSYDAVLITGPSKAQKAAIVKRAGALTKVRDLYQSVFQFKQVEWTLAALYRIGNLYETFSEKLFAAPPPPEVAKLGAEFVEEYRVLIEQQAVPLEDKAVEAYKRTIAEAKKGGVANEWTKSTLRSLNKLRKKEFPLQKDARYALELSGFGTPQLLGVNDKQPASQEGGEAVAQP